MRRHFFLVAAVAVLLLMIAVGGFKLATREKGPGGGGPGGGAMAMQGGGGPPGKGGPMMKGGRGGFGGPAQVAAAVVQPRAFTDAIEVLGVAKGRRSVTLTAAATQLVERVRFSDGQSVPAGAVLVELRDNEQTAGTAQAQARLVQARRAYERYRQLGERGFASKAQIDQVEAAYRTAQADVSAARARENDRVIRAPFSGVVGLSDVTPGALVNPGAPIVTLDDLSAIRVDFQVPERYLSQVAEGQAITAEVDAYPGEVINGRISRIDTRVDERTRAITARAEFPNPGRRLKPGMMIRVSISRGVRQSLAAPESAVSVQGNSAFVYVIRQMGQRTMTEQRPVVTGIRQAGFVEIREGVQAGERIVADGLNKVQPGMPVRVVGGRGPGGPGRPGMGGPGAPGGGAAPAAAGGAASQGGGQGAAGGVQPSPQMQAARQAMMQACAADMQKLCAGQDGREAFMCLRQNSAKASPACQAALAKARPAGGQARS
ncbi:efflux RND transporter periplasmic adaptor subunit [Phenylobacterium sp.]|uniref:efflux RND transporter periplasmic adaptor subunit n=1 Tax=Phenylobacterium sp. TaxID=1871053 RepID=UPI002F933359